MGITGNTQLGPTKAALIAAVAQKELKFKAKLLPYVTDVSRFAEPGSKSIDFPKFTTAFTVEKRASGVAGTIQDLTTANDQLLLNQNAYISWLIDSTDKLQSRLDVELEYVQRAAAAHGRGVDTDIFAEAAAVASLALPAGAITRDDVLDMREHLLKVVDPEDLSNAAMFVAVDQEKEMLKIQEFSRADIYGKGIIPTGIIGSVYGIPVILHRGLAAGKVFMWHKEGIATGFQKAPQMDEQKAIGYGTGAVQKAMDQLYGMKGMHLGLEGAAAGKSPLVASLG